MEMKNEQRISISRDQAWEALNDPEVLRVCIPGCESFEEVDENTYDATVHTKVGPVKARFKGQVTLEDLQPPHSYTLRFEGKGGQAGFAQGNARVTLDEEEGGCRVAYSVSATVGGKLAQLGNRLVKGAAEKNANDFFANFARHMGEEPGTQDVTEGGGAGTRAPAGSSGAQSRWLWVAGGAVVVIILIILLI